MSPAYHTVLLVVGTIILRLYHLFDLNAPLFSNIFMTGNLHKNTGNLNEITSISFKLAAFLCHDTAVVGNFYGKFCIKFCGCIIYLVPSLS